jgi:hypothetical protein
MRAIAALLFCFVSTAQADGLKFGEGWTRADTTRQAALTALLVADWVQTRSAVKHPLTKIDGIVMLQVENNPFLGEHPSIGRVNNYFAASIIGHALIGAVLPADWRSGWQYVWIGIQSQTVYRNYQVGLKMGF